MIYDINKQIEERKDALMREKMTADLLATLETIRPDYRAAIEEVIFEVCTHAPNDIQLLSKEEFTQRVEAVQQRNLRAKLGVETAKIVPFSLTSSAESSKT